MIILMYKVLRFGSTIVVWVNVVRRIRVFRSKGKNVVSRLASLSCNIMGSINLSLPIPHIWASHNVMQSILHFSTLPTLIPLYLHIWHRKKGPHADPPDISTVRSNAEHPLQSIVQFVIHCFHPYNLLSRHMLLIPAYTGEMPLFPLYIPKASTTLPFPIP